LFANDLLLDSQSITMAFQALLLILETSTDQTTSRRASYGTDN
jgi:hypothetical protein